MIKGKVEYKNTLNTTFIILFILRRDIPIKLLKRMMIPLSQSTPSRSFESGKKLLATSSVGGDTSAPKEEKKKAPPDAGEVLKKALRRAGEGGLAGAAAMGINVCALMWIRTTINYQYRYGTGTTENYIQLIENAGIDFRGNSTGAFNFRFATKQVMTVDISGVQMKNLNVTGELTVNENLYGRNNTSKSLIKFQTKLGQNSLYYYNLDLDKYYKTENNILSSLYEKLKHHEKIIKEQSKNQLTKN